MLGRTVTRKVPLFHKAAIRMQEIVCSTRLRVGFPLRYGMSMKALPALVFLFLVALSGLTSCSLTGDAEDKAFYNSGWLHPEAGANDRLMRDSSTTRPYPR